MNLPLDAPVMYGFSPIPIGAIVRIIRSSHRWEMETLWKVEGYCNKIRTEKMVTPSTMLTCQALTEHNMSKTLYGQFHAWCVEIVEDGA